MPEESIIAIAIVLLTLILYMIPKIPLSVTTIISMLSMAATGIISYEDAFSGFSNSATLLVVGMMIMGQSFFSCGLAEQIGNTLYNHIGNDEKHFIVIVLIVGSILGIFLNGTLVVAILMPVIDSIIYQSNGSITKKHTYFPLGIASVMGNNMTTISATSMITASGLVSAAGYKEMGVFTPTLVNLPALIIIIFLYIIVGYKLQIKWFDFDETPVKEMCIAKRKKADINTFKISITIMVISVSIIAMILGMNYGAVSLFGASVLIITGCISEKDAFKSVNWSTVIIVAGAIGFSKGVTNSGAGEYIAKFILNICGPLGGSVIGVTIIMFVIGSILSNLMSDNASVAILVPIVLVIANEMSTDPIPMVISTASGIKMAVCTPISVAPMTMIQGAGYRFKDYLRVGGLINLLALIIICIAIMLIYYL